MVNIQSGTFVVDICGNTWIMINKLIERPSLMCPVTFCLSYFGHKQHKQKTYKQTTEQEGDLLSLLHSSAFLFLEVPFFHLGPKK